MSDAIPYETTVEEAVELLIGLAANVRRKKAQADRFRSIAARLRSDLAEHEAKVRDAALAEVEAACEALYRHNLLTGQGLKHNNAVNACLKRVRALRSPSVSLAPAPICVCGDPARHHRDGTGLCVKIGCGCKEFTPACDGCLHVDVDPEVAPCASCYEKRHWTPKVAP